MAEIKIEKKSPVWPWILLVLVIIGVVVYFMYANKEADDVNDDYDDVTNEQVMDSTRNDRPITDSTPLNYDSTPYSQYLAFEGAIKDSTRIAVDTSYTKKAYYNLTKAAAKKAEESGIEQSQELTDLQEFSALITKVSIPSSHEKAKNFKTAGDKVATVLEAVQQKSYPNLQTEVAELKTAASNIDGTKNMSKQQNEISRFLQKSREVLKGMNDKK